MLTLVYHGLQKNKRIAPSAFIFQIITIFLSYMATEGTFLVNWEPKSIASSIYAITRLSPEWLNKSIKLNLLVNRWRTISSPRKTTSATTATVANQLHYRQVSLCHQHTNWIISSISRYLLTPWHLFFSVLVTDSLVRSILLVFHHLNKSTYTFSIAMKRFSFSFVSSRQWMFVFPYFTLGLSSFPVEHFFLVFIFIILKCFPLALLLRVLFTSSLGRELDSSECWWKGHHEWQSNDHSCPWLAFIHRYNWFIVSLSPPYPNTVEKTNNLNWAF